MRIITPSRPLPSSPLTQKFSLTIGGQTRPLDRDGFSDVSFRGEYPIGIVEYADADVPLAVKLEAFSPFIPLNTDDSSLPATILQFTLRNTSAAPVEATLGRGIGKWRLPEPSRTGRHFAQPRPARAGPDHAALLGGKIRVTAGAAARTLFLKTGTRKLTMAGGWKARRSAAGRSKNPKFRPIRVTWAATRRAWSTRTLPRPVIRWPPGTAPPAGSSAVISPSNATSSRFWIGGGKGRGNSRHGLTLFVDGQAGADGRRPRSKPDVAATFRCPRLRRQNGAAGNSR